MAPEPDPSPVPSRSPTIFKISPLSVYRRWPANLLAPTSAVHWRPLVLSPESRQPECEPRPCRSTAYPPTRPIHINSTTPTTSPPCACLGNRFDSPHCHHTVTTLSISTYTVPDLPPGTRTRVVSPPGLWPQTLLPVGPRRHSSPSSLSSHVRSHHHTAESLASFLPRPAAQTRLTSTHTKVDRFPSSTPHYSAAYVLLSSN